MCIINHDQTNEVQLWETVIKNEVSYIENIVIKQDTYPNQQISFCNEIEILEETNNICIELFS